MEKVVIGNATLYRADCFDVFPLLPMGGVDLVVTDPPYNGVVKAEWDNQWKNDDKFLMWLDRAFGKIDKLLSPTGSLYCFASPRMSSRVESKLAQYFSVLNHLVWVKPNNRGNRACKEKLRSFWDASERVLFCESTGARVAALTRDRGFIYAPIRDYLTSEWKRSGRSIAEAKQIFTSAQVSHFFCSSVTFWRFPQEVAYVKMRNYLRPFCPDAFSRSYSSLADEYRQLKQEYEAQRRVFKVSQETQFTDVWSFSAPHNTGRLHPTQKPTALIQHMILASSRCGDTVFDPFMGSGTTGAVAVTSGRKFVGVEKDRKYFDIACRRIKEAQSQLKVKACR